MPFHYQNCGCEPRCFTPSFWTRAGIRIFIIATGEKSGIFLNLDALAVLSIQPFLFLPFLKFTHHMRVFLPAQRIEYRENDPRAK